MFIKYMILSFLKEKDVGFMIPRGWKIRLSVVIFSKSATNLKSAYIIWTAVI